MPNFTIDPRRPSDTLEACAGQLAMLSDLLSAAPGRCLEMSDAGLSGMANLLQGAADAMGEVARLLVKTDRAANTAQSEELAALEARLHRIGHVFEGGILAELGGLVARREAEVAGLLDAVNPEDRDFIGDADMARAIGAMLAKDIRRNAAPPPPVAARGEAPPPRLIEPRPAAQKRRAA